MRNFIIGMLGWWVGLTAALIVGALLMGELFGMDTESMSYGFSLFGLGIAGGFVGVRATSRFRKPAEVKLNRPLT